VEVDLEYRARYFDNAATTPMDPLVAEEMLPFLGDSFGNANSIHEPGRRAAAAVELARMRVADLLGGDPVDIFFTSGATEANNWVASQSDYIACSPFEHSSMMEAVRFKPGSLLANEGYNLTFDPSELVDPWQKLRVVSVMRVNNETGAILTAADISDERVHLHRDLTQAIGKIDELTETPISAASFSAHKFYGPKGVGCLWNPSMILFPMLLGGEHEDGQRAGTLNVPGIVGMGCAAAIAAEEGDKNRRHAEMLRALVLEGVEKIQDFQLNSPPNSSPYIVSLSFLGVEGETLVVELDHIGFSISSGAACSSKSTEPSHVLTALGMAPEWIRGTVRISFGKYNTEAAAVSLAKELRAAVEKLRTMH
jgi:cysteine desulfurase